MPSPSPLPPLEYQPQNVRDAEALRVVREIPAKPPSPLDLPALVAELWGEAGKSDLLG